MTSGWRRDLRCSLTRNLNKTSNHNRYIWIISIRPDSKIYSIPFQYLWSPITTRLCKTLMNSSKSWTLTTLAIRINTCESLQWKMYPTLSIIFLLKTIWSSFSISFWTAQLSKRVRKSRSDSFFWTGTRLLKAVYLRWKSTKSLRLLNKCLSFWLKVFKIQKWTTKTLLSNRSSKLKSKVSWSSTLLEYWTYFRLNLEDLTKRLRARFFSILITASRP